MFVPKGFQITADVCCLCAVCARRRGVSRSRAGMRTARRSRHLVARSALVLLVALASAVACDRNSDTAESSAAPSVASSSPTAQSSSRVHDSSTCILSPQELGGLVAPLYSGPVTIYIDHFGVGYEDSRCHYLLDGSSAGAGFEITAQRYSDNVVFTVSSKDFEFEYGGSSPQQVLTSATAALQGEVAQSPGSEGFASYPDVGAGMVTNRRNELVLAGTGDYWYTGSVSGVSLSPSQPNNDMLVAIGTAMAAVVR